MIDGINIIFKCDKCKECTVLGMPIEKDNKCIYCGRKLIDSDSFPVELYLKIAKLANKKINCKKRAIVLLQDEERY